MYLPASHKTTEDYAQEEKQEDPRADRYEES